MRLNGADEWQPVASAESIGQAEAAILVHLHDERMFEADMGVMLHRIASERALELPGAELTHPFGEEWDVYKVRGKVFMLQTTLDGCALVTVKTRPGDGKLLCEAFPEISPGYHMNKRHWITVRPGGIIEPGLLADLVTESFLLVLENSVPKSQWPVDPATFGQRDSLS